MLTPEQLAQINDPPLLTPHEESLHWKTKREIVYDKLVERVPLLLPELPRDKRSLGAIASWIARGCGERDKLLVARAERREARLREMEARLAALKGKT